jgi:hypothetical protein
MIQRKRLLVMLVLLVGISASANAAVLCANPSESVFVRLQCKGNEIQLDPVALGLVGPPGPGVRTIAGFVYADGTTFGSGFIVTKLGTGQYQILFPPVAFTDFPAVAVSAWGFPGQAPTANVLFNDVVGGSWRVVVWMVGPDGVTPIDAGFQFVAAES